MDKMTQILKVTRIAAQPEAKVLVHTEPVDGSTWGGQPFLVDASKQPYVGQTLVLTIEDRPGI